MSTLNFNDIQSSALSKYDTVVVDFEFNEQERKCKFNNLLLQKPDQRARTSAAIDAAVKIGQREDGDTTSTLSDLNDTVIALADVLRAAADNQSDIDDLLTLCDGSLPVITSIFQEYMGTTQAGEAAAS